MGLTREVVERIPREDQVIALRMKVGGKEKDFLFLVLTKEGPNDLKEFSLGAASALNATGTSWSNITDSAGRYHLQPEFERYLYQAFYGISPSYAWVYRRYPANVDLGSLLSTRTIGGQVGYVSGGQSPIATPSPITEFWTLKGVYPSFLGYHPFAEPSSATVRMTFFVTKFRVDYLVAPTEEQLSRAIRRTMGGTELLEAPEWVR